MMGPMEGYTRGYLDALDTFERFKDELPVEVAISTCREWLIEKFPEAIRIDREVAG